jgi:hypothetical protein
MWDPYHLTTLLAFTSCYWNIFLNVWTHVFLTSALVGSISFTSRLYCPWGKIPRIHWTRWCVGLFKSIFYVLHILTSLSISVNKILVEFEGIILTLERVNVLKIRVWVVWFRNRYGTVTAYCRNLTPPPKPTAVWRNARTGLMVWGGGDRECIHHFQDETGGIPLPLKTL